MADQFVYPDGSGRWIATDDASSDRRSTHTTQADAIAAARDRCAATGGGELVIHAEDGKIRAKNTVAPGNDPSSVPG